LPQGVLIYADNQVFDEHANFKGIVLHAQFLSLHGDLDTFKQRCEQFARQFTAKV